jgi:EAL domain-containing protein (putative c-di-GMP-specific phosphodiesterase class I)
LRQIKLLRQDGIQLAIDDFGQTLDDFSLVDVLKASYLKTDRSLLRCSPAWLQDIVAAGRKAGLKMVIEGIETEEEARRFGSLGDFNQGFFYGEPLPIEEVAT